MRGRLRTILLLAGCGLAATVAAQSNPPQPPPPPAPMPPEPPLVPLSQDWRIVETPPTKPGTVGKRYRELNEARCKRLRAISPSLEALCGSDTRFNAVDGVEGEWTFLNPQDRKSPTQAVQIVDRSTPDAYAVALRLHCEDDAAACAVLREQALQLPLPKPQERFAPTTHHMLMGYRQWLDLLQKEACTEGEEKKPAPRYPIAALRRNMDADTGPITMRLVIAFNSCGNVRDAWVSRSSNDRDIDREALRTALGWRVKPPQPTKQSQRSLAQVPITFAY